MKLIKVVCENCGKEFGRLPYEVKRNKRLGRKQYCSQVCNGKTQAGRMRVIANRWTKETAKLLAGNKRDEYTGFRALLRRAQGRKRDFDITLQDLKDQWEVQQGVCVYSGIKLILPDPYWAGRGIPKFVLASLDRIDSAKGYIARNIQFVSVTINYAKNGMTHEQMLEFCEVMKIGRLPESGLSAQS